MRFFKFNLITVCSIAAGGVALFSGTILFKEARSLAKFFNGSKGRSELAERSARLTAEPAEEASAFEPLPPPALVAADSVTEVASAPAAPSAATAPTANAEP